MNITNFNQIFKDIYLFYKYLYKIIIESEESVLILNGLKDLEIKDNNTKTIAGHKQYNLFYQNKFLGILTFYVIEYENEIEYVGEIENVTIDSDNNLIVTKIYQLDNIIQQIYGSANLEDINYITELMYKKGI